MKSDMSVLGVTWCAVYRLNIWLCVHVDIPKQITFIFQTKQSVSD